MQIWWVDGHEELSLGFDEVDKPDEASWEANGRVAEADCETDEVNKGDNGNEVKNISKFQKIVTR